MGKAAGSRLDRKLVLANDGQQPDGVACMDYHAKCSDWASQVSHSPHDLPASSSPCDGSMVTPADQSHLDFQLVRTATPIICIRPVLEASDSSVVFYKCLRPAAWTALLYL